MSGIDKPLLPLGGRLLIEHVVERLTPQCEGLIISANGDPARFADFGLPVVPDPLPDHPGPLAGILGALEWAASYRPTIEWVASVPGDTPFVPTDLLPRLHEARAAAQAHWACAASGPRRHFAVALWPVDLRRDLRNALERGVRSIREWAGGRDSGCASWTTEPFDPFLNINTFEDLSEATALASRYPEMHVTSPGGARSKNSQ
jgi:molybdopterin-guanine dinucleotide biosynthesis protein A